MYSTAEQNDIALAPAPGHSDLRKKRIRPAKSVSSTEEVLRQANSLFREEQSRDLRSAIAQKLEDLRHYDVLRMDRVLAICCWGRSGSLLLASYLDGHEDVVALPGLYGRYIFQFFDRHSSLSLREKLLAYPAIHQPYTPFFEGDLAISSRQYYATVQAILELYKTVSPEILGSRRAFFIFLHVAYHLALGRPPVNSRSLIVYQQHDWNTKLAENLVADFPLAKFAHSVRDPISVFCRGFNHTFSLDPDLSPQAPPDAAESRSPWFRPFSPLTPWLDPYLYVMNKDLPHQGMESRTRAVRFEDLHRDIAGTMRAVSDWLGLSWRPSLIESTFNGNPWVVTSDRQTLSGQHQEQTQRRSTNVSPADRALLFALFYENFAGWGYPCRKIFGNPLVRCAVFLPLLLLPMKTEIITARALFARRILPSLRRGDIFTATQSILRILFSRLMMISLLMAEFARRGSRRRTLLQVVHPGAESTA